MANNTARDVDRAWMLMDKIGFAMLMTSDGDPNVRVVKVAI